MRERLAPACAEIVERGSMPARRPASIRLASARQETTQVIRDFPAADLDPIGARQHPQLVAQRAQILEAGLDSLDSARMKGSRRAIDWK